MRTKKCTQIIIQIDGETEIVIINKKKSINLN